MSGVRNPMDLSGRRILVTGASSGIGAATAAYLAGLGAAVVLAARNEARLAETAAGLSGSGHEVAPFDLGQTGEIGAWIKGLTASNGPLHGIAHCAGMQATKPIRMLTPAFFEEVQRVNLGSALALAQAYRQRGCAGEGASLVFVSSSAAIRGAPGNVVYAASKGALLAAIRGLALEMVSDKIRVNGVAPALVETEMTRKFRTALSDENYQKVVAMHPLGIGQPDDVAYAIAFLLAPAARWMTGTTLEVSGGFLA